MDVDQRHTGASAFIVTLAVDSTWGMMEGRGDLRETEVEERGYIYTSGELIPLLTTVSVVVVMVVIRMWLFHC
jgi:hypothetical protein